MQSTVAVLGFVAAALALPQAPAAGTKSPSGSAPAGCSANYNGKFTFQPITVSKRATTADACQGSAVVVTLKDGVLTDSQNRQGDVVQNGVNTQFQFDAAPGQAGYLYNAGFSVCSNTSIALGPTTVFYSCKSGTFSNIYYTVNQELLDSKQCEPIGLQMLPCSGSTAPSGPAQQQSDGQPTGTPVAPAGQQTDGQPTGTPVAPVTQITDGQPQAQTAVPVQQITDGQIQMSAAMPVNQITDGQIQATNAPVPVSQIGDGQIQASGVAPVSQIGDGQIQATPTAGAPVSQLSDGQIQATSVTPVTQIGDGQIQGNATSSPVPFTGAASSLNIGSQLAAIVLGAVAVAFL